MIISEQNKRKIKETHFDLVLEFAESNCALQNPAGKSLLFLLKNRRLGMDMGKDGGLLS